MHSVKSFWNSACNWRQQTSVKSITFFVIALLEPDDLLKLSEYSEIVLNNLCNFNLLILVDEDIKILKIVYL